jgi:hypothetical protein
MNHEHSFDVRRYKNRNGVSSWRVSGRLHGVRIRRNFKSKEEAAAEKAALKIKAENETSGLRSITTRLTAEQAREAEAVFQRLEGRGRSLAFYVDFALATYRDPIHDRSIAEATKDYLALRASDESQGQLSHRHALSFGLELRALEAVFRRKTVSELTPDALTTFLKRGLPSKKTFNNRRGLVGPFLKYCVLKDWIAKNPIDRVPHFRGVGHRRGSAPTLSATQCAEIMEWAENERQGALVPFIALCLFAGIRPDPYVGEIAKLDSKDVRLDTGVILVEPEVSKVRMKRAVTIQPNLAISHHAPGTSAPQAQIPQTVQPLARHSSAYLRFDVRRQVPIDGRSRTPSRKLREHHPQTLPGLEEPRRSRRVLQNPASGRESRCSLPIGGLTGSRVPQRGWGRSPQIGRRPKLKNFR